MTNPTHLLLSAALLLGSSALPFATPVSAQDQEFDPEALMDLLEKRNGTFEGFRRAHAKGMCGRGTFKASGMGEEYSEAGVFKKDAVSAVTFRFSDAGGNPFANDKREGVRAMALIVQSPDGEEWRTAMNSIPMFMVKDPIAFMDFNKATMPNPDTGAPDPAKVGAFMQAHPEAGRLFQHLASNPPARSFQESHYHSINAFFFVTGDEKRTAVRWEMVPDAGYAPLDPAALAGASDNFLFEGLQKSVTKSPATWTLEAQIGEEGDDTTDPTTPWPKERKRVTLGTLTLNEAGPNLASICEGENFDPLYLPTGIEPSEDKILYARSGAYAASFGRRYTEREDGKVAKKP